MFHKRLDMRFFLSALFVVLTQVAVAQTDVSGCTIEIACNYDPSATIDDGSCDFTSCLVLGCTDSAACNYNPAATINDGSCDFLSCLVPGCTLANACNYDPAAEVNDGSCEYTSCAGCTNEFADNYDATATVDDGSCNPIWVARALRLATSTRMPTKTTGLATSCRVSRRVARCWRRATTIQKLK